jgi:hypothetical protein
MRQIGPDPCKSVVLLLWLLLGILTFAKLMNFF